MGLSLSRVLLLWRGSPTRRATILCDATFGKDFVPVSSDCFYVVRDLIARIMWVARLAYRGYV